jgi:alpha-1,3-rhamnosyl/mannosyltransferase
MRIAIDARSLTDEPVTGVGKHLGGLLSVLGRTGARHEWFLYSNRALPWSAPGWHTRLLAGTALTRRGAPWLELHARPAAVADRVDVFWGPCFLVPVTLPRGIAALASLHDLVYPDHAGTMRLAPWLTMRAFFSASNRRADHFLALSRTVAGELETRLGLPRERITVASPGVAPPFHSRDRAGRPPCLASLPGSYVLAVATLEPRKNLETLVRAFLALPEPLRREFPLVVAGSPGWKSSHLARLAERGVAEGTIRFVGYVPDVDLPALYSGATLLALPSLYEGFGMPAIESMACGTPVLLSDIAVFREVAGDAATFVAPRDEAAWSRDLEALLRDPARRESQRVRGLERARSYTFEESADRVLSVIEALGARGARAPIEQPPR